MAYILLNLIAYTEEWYLLIKRMSAENQNYKIKYLRLNSE